MRVALMCFNSDFLERKLQGLKQIQKILQDAKYAAGQQQHYSIDQLSAWVDQNHIFEKLYGAQGHIQLIQRSGDFLKFMINENMLSEE